MKTYLICKFDKTNSLYIVRSMRGSGEEEEFYSATVEKNKDEIIVVLRIKDIEDIINLNKRRWFDEKAGFCKMW